MDKIFVKDSYFSCFMENHYLEETKGFKIRINGNFQRQITNFFCSLSFAYSK